MLCPAAWLYELHRDQGDCPGGNLVSSQRLSQWLQVTHPLLLHLEHDCEARYIPAMLETVDVTQLLVHCPGLWRRWVVYGRGAVGMMGVEPGRLGVRGPLESSLWGPSKPLMGVRLLQLPSHTSQGL